MAASVRFYVPRVRDLTNWLEGPPEEGGLRPADLVLISKEQLEQPLGEMTEVEEVTPNTPSVFLIPYGRGFLGIPSCDSPPGKTCWPVKGGLDDNPLAYTCACLEEPGELPGPWSPLVFCHMDIEVQGERLRFRCIRGADCTGRCQMIFVRQGRLIRIACECQS